MRSKPTAEPSRPLLVTALVVGVGNAIGVPWAVFRYGPAAGVDPDVLQAMGLVGVVGGTLLALLAGGAGVLFERGARRAGPGAQEPPSEDSGASDSPATPVPASSVVELDEVDLHDSATQPAEADTFPVAAAKSVVGSLRALSRYARGVWARSRAAKVA